MAIGIGCSAWILSMTFDMNFNRLTCFILVTAQCTLSGAFGGYIGNAMVTYCCAPAIVEQNIADISLLDSSFTSSESLSISELSSDVQELLKVWYTDAELDALIEQAEANEAANIINSMHSVKGTI